jgi:hypothetical protein
MISQNSIIAEEAQDEYPVFNNGGYESGDHAILERDETAMII